VIRNIYTTKSEWEERSSIKECIHCGNEIYFRPVTIGIYENPVGSGTVVMGRFDTWLCARAYANTYTPSYEMERLTTMIMKDFRDQRDHHDDPCSLPFLAHYTRFIDVPAAPYRDKFEKFGGPISYESFRRAWTSSNGIRPFTIISANAGDNDYSTENISDITGVHVYHPLQYIPKRTRSKK